MQARHYRKVHGGTWAVLASTALHLPQLRLVAFLLFFESTCFPPIRFVVTLILTMHFRLETIPSANVVPSNKQNSLSASNFCCCYCCKCVLISKMTKCYLTFTSPTVGVNFKFEQFQTVFLPPSAVQQPKMGLTTSQVEAPATNTTPADMPSPIANILTRSQAYQDTQTPEMPPSSRHRSVLDPRSPGAVRTPIENKDMADPRSPLRTRTPVDNNVPRRRVRSNIFI